MAKVTDIGGLFLRSQDPKALAEWYATHLGIGGPKSGWQQQAKPTVFTPSPPSSPPSPPTSITSLPTANTC